MLLLALNLAMCFSPGILNWDEGYYLNAALGYAQHGSLHVRMWDIPEPTKLIVGGGPGLAVIGYFEYLRLFANSSAEAARLFGFFWLLLAVLLCHYYCRRLIDSEAASWITLAFTVSVGFAHFISARFDAIILCVMFGLLMAFQRLHQHPKLAAHALLGLLPIVLMEFHIYLAVYAAAIGGWYVWATAQGKVAPSRLVAFGLGAALAATSYYLVHLHQADPAFAVVRQNCAFCGLGFLDSLGLRLSSLLSRYPCEMLLVCFTTVAALRGRWVPGANAILALFGVATFVVLIPPHYELFIWPLLVPIVAAGLKQLMKSDAPVVALAVLMLFALFLRSAALSSARILPDDSTKKAALVAQCVGRRLPAGSTLLAPGPMFRFMPEQSNFFEIGRGARYAALLAATGQNLSVEEALTHWLNQKQPAAIWLGDSDDAWVSLQISKWLTAPTSSYHSSEAQLYWRSDLPIDPCGP